MTTTIRLAEPSDAEALGDLAAATFPLACPPSAAPDSIAKFIQTHLSPVRFLDYIADPGRIVVLAEHDGLTAGYTMLVGGEPTDENVATALKIRPTIELSKVYVRLDSHGTGLAQPLFDETMAQAKTTGARGIWLGVNQENVRAQRFYQKRGFAVVGPKTFYVGLELHHDYVMERPLEA